MAVTVGISYRKCIPLAHREPASDNGSPSIEPATAHSCSRRINFHGFNAHNPLPTAARTLQDRVEQVAVAGHRVNHRQCGSIEGDGRQNPAEGDACKELT